MIPSFIILSWVLSVIYYFSCFEFSFTGKFGDVGIGRVYAEDADDWDLPDKTFTYLSPELYKAYFRFANFTFHVFVLLLNSHML